MHLLPAQTPVFFDPKGKRWRLFKMFTALSVFMVIIVFLTLIFQILTQSNLPFVSQSVSDDGEVFTVQNGRTQRISNVNNKYLALTFDDGPDPRNTPQILNILKNHNVPATFFIVGANANNEPQLLEQIYKDGHEIGNHTYTHLNSEKVTDTQLALELKATQELLESRLGVRTRLFRAPYSDDRDPETASQLEPIKVASQMGYVSVGMKIDPKDWKAESADEIVDRIDEYVNEGRGNIILLHDGGDDRKNTISALPKIIERMESQGYEFVPVSTLIGWESAYVKPTGNKFTGTANLVSLFGFDLIKYSGISVKLLAIISSVIGIGRFVLVTIFAIVDKNSKNKRTYDDNFQPKVAAIVPAYNEEKVVAKTVDSLLSSTYPNLEVVVVDDGSSDRTHEVVNEYFANHPRVKNFKKQNGGKSSAINFGLENTDAEIVIILDADTIIESDAIAKLARHFKDSNVGAVAGNAKVGNRVNFLTNLQAIEYITSQNLERCAFNVFNSIRVVAGAIGAWRRDLLLQAGGFTHDTLAEDTDMTLRILRMGYKIEYDATAIALTEAPESVQSFMKQRFRWMHGTFQAIWKHMDTLFNSKFGMMGIIAIPDVLVFQVFFPLFAPVMDFFLVSNIAFTLLNIYQHPTSYSTIALQQALFYYVAFMLFDYAAAGLSFAMEKKENWKLLFYLFFQRFVYRQLLYISAIKSTIAAIKGEKVGWGKLERTSTVPHTFKGVYPASSS